MDHKVVACHPRRKAEITIVSKAIFQAVLLRFQQSVRCSLLLAIAFLPLAVVALIIYGSTRLQASNFDGKLIDMAL